MLAAQDLTTIKLLIFNFNTLLDRARDVTGQRSGARPSRASAGHIHNQSLVWIARLGLCRAVLSSAVIVGLQADNEPLAPNRVTVNVT